MKKSIFFVIVISIFYYCNSNNNQKPELQLTNLYRSNLIFVSDNYIFPYKSNLLLNKNVNINWKYLHKQNLNFKLSGYEEYLKDNIDSIKAKFNLGKVDTVLSSGLSSIAYKFSLKNNTIIMRDGKARKKFEIYKIRRTNTYALIYDIYMQTNRDLSYISIKDNKISLVDSSTWKIDPIKFYLPLKMGLEILIIKGEYYTEFGKKKYRTLLQKKEKLIPISFENVDYICTSSSGIFKLADDLDKQILNTEYPFLYKFADRIKSE